MTIEEKNISPSMCGDEEDTTPLTLIRMLVEEKNFSENEIETGLTITTKFNNETVVSRITLVVRLGDRRIMILRYAPGSVVTRTRSAVAAARVLDDSYQIPLTVVTNGSEVEMLDNYTGKVLGRTFADIPSRQELAGMLDTLRFEPFTDGKKRERELRVLNAFDVDL